MRKLLAALCAASALVAAPALAVTTVGNLGTANSASVLTTLNITTTQDAPVGSVVVVAMELDAGVNASTVNATDNAGTPNSYTRASTGCSFNTGGASSFFLYAPITHDLPSGGTITVNFGGSKPAITAAVILSPPAGTVGIDVQPACATGTGTSASLGSGALAASNDVLFGAVGTHGSISAFAANSPLSTLTGTGNSGFIEWGYEVSPASGGITFGPSWTTSRAFGANIWALKFTSVVTCSGSPLALLGVGSC